MGSPNSAVNTAKYRSQHSVLTAGRMSPELQTNLPVSVSADQKLTRMKSRSPGCCDDLLECFIYS